ncbi:MAG: hypothetical protein Q7K57_57575 [Burkholderiaceae bacterium]|nr:hypothetical protein [Polaromonas sp.]MDO8778180.1 hypothetical protein [Burkholderiaceae bacterium]
MTISEHHHLGTKAFPKAERVLRDLRGVATFEQEHGFRHPTAAYNVSLSIIGQRIQAVLDANREIIAASAFRKPGDTASDKKLLEAIDHMLDAQMEHFSVCGSVLQSFFRKEDEKLSGKAHTAFKQAVRPYRDHIARIDNYIKHSQGTLRSLAFSWPGNLHFGYFVEGPTGANALGPAPNIHPGNTAYSLNRDISYQVCSVFAVGAQLARSLHEIDRTLVPLADVPQGTGNDSSWATMLRMTAALPTVYFPDEVHKPVPRVNVSGNRLHIEYPSQCKRSSTPERCGIAVNMRGDGVTTTFHTPYLDTFHPGAQPFSNAGVPIPL